MLRFQKNKSSIQALINSSSKVNAMLPTYAKKLGLQIWKTDVRAQKIDGSPLNIFEMVIIGFQIYNKLKRARFFQETFLMVDTSMEMVLGMLFLTLSKVDIDFANIKLT